MSSLGMIGTYDSTSDSSSEEEGEEEGEKVVETAVPLPATGGPSLSNPFKMSSSKSSLPRPSFMQEHEDFSTTSARPTSSVFSNPFRDKEEQHRTLLERHVAMTARQEEMRTIGGKKVCWNFRKGRCRFGHKCTFAHDSDIGVRRPDPKDLGPTYSAESSISDPGGGRKLQQEEKAQLSRGSCDQGSMVSGEGSIKKKRPGLSQDIVPSRKAMKFHNKVYNSAV